MFAYIRGTLLDCNPIHAIIDTAGIGYKIFIPPTHYTKLPQIGEELALHLSFVVRELSQTLYGFHTAQERDVFELLMSASGVGPKLALSIIGHLSFEQVQEAIQNGNAALIQRVPGIGKKGAEKLIVELGGTFDSRFPARFSIPSCSVRAQDALSALVNLGYGQSAAQKAIEKSTKELSENVDLGVLITHSLRNLSGNK